MVTTSLHGTIYRPWYTTMHLATSRAACAWEVCCALNKVAPKEKKISINGTHCALPHAATRRAAGQALQDLI